MEDNGNGCVSARIKICVSNQTFLCKYADYREFCRTDSNILADGIASAEQRSSQAGAQHDDFLFAVDFSLRKETSAGNGHITDGRKACRGTQQFNALQCNIPKSDIF